MKYKYKMFDGSSGLVTGEMDADSMEEVKDRLHEGGYRVISIEKSGGSFHLTKPRRMLPKGQLAVMFSQLALMSSGGLDCGIRKAGKVAVRGFCRCRLFSPFRPRHD